MLGIKNTANSGSAKRLGETWEIVYNNNYGWTSLDTNSSGSTVFAAGTASTTGGIYTGAEYGTSWKKTSLGNFNWSCIKATPDGNTILMAIKDGPSSASSGIWKITGGTNVFQLDPSIRKYSDVAVSDNGQIMYAVVGQYTATLPGLANTSDYVFGYIYVSTDGGSTWTQRGNSNIYTSVVCSPDGTTAWASCYGATPVKTTNSGTSWSAVIANNGIGYNFAASSNMQILANSSNQFFRVSRDGGVTWNQSNPSVIAEWRNVKMSSDGRRMIIHDFTNNRIYVSSDSGLTWQRKWNPSSQQTWVDIAMSSDGKTIYGATTSAIYKSTIP